MIDCMSSGERVCYCTESLAHSLEKVGGACLDRKTAARVWRSDNITYRACDPVIDLYVFAGLHEPHHEASFVMIDCIRSVENSARRNHWRRMCNVRGTAWNKLRALYRVIGYAHVRTREVKGIHADKQELKYVLGGRQASIMRANNRSTNVHTVHDSS